METLASLRRATNAVLCQECGKCTAMCPLGASENFTARAIIHQDPEKGIQGYAAAVQRCLTCASCEVRCPQGVRFAEFVRGVRELIPAHRRLPCPHGQVLQSAARIMAGSNVPVRDTRWIGDDLRVAQEGDTALFIGCLPLFELTFGQELGVEMLEIARSAIRILNRLGIEPVVVADERCCGHDLLWSGDRQGFVALAKANAAAFAKRGVTHILTTCAECCRTWRLDYGDVVGDYQPRVEHFAEFLAEQVKSDRIAFEEDGVSKVTYQDPCRLGRHLGVYDPPREVLAAMPGVTMMEMNRTGQDATCCGTAGFIHCDADSRRLQVERLADAADTGAETLVTTCPKCLIHFSCAREGDRRAKRNPPSIEVQDLTVLAARTMRCSPKEASIGR